MKKDRVPVLFTCDIDPTPEVNMNAKKKALERTSELFDAFHIKATYFFVANYADPYKSIIRKLVETRNEIGCHGLDHSLEEEYNRMPEKNQRTYLTQATRKLEDIANTAIRSFRGPRVKTSPVTQKILIDLGYVVDASICSQRIDFISSNLVNPGWIIAPRLPYRPHINSSYRRGQQNLWIVPNSALILPFVSGILYAFGLSFMKTFFQILYLESKLTGKPIVYLMHPSEFAAHSKYTEKTTIQAIKSRGLYLRRKLKLRVDEKRRYDYTHSFLNHLSNYNDLEFATLSSYVTTPEFMKMFNKYHYRT